MFEVNQLVSYGPNGVFKIEEISDKNLTGSIKKYYVLKSANSNGSIVYVPVENDKLVAKMHPVLTADEVREIIKGMPEEDCGWIDNDEQRKQKFHQVILQSDPRELGRLIHSVYLHQEEISTQGKKLHIADKRAFEEAERILYDLISLVMDISVDAVPEFIEKTLAKTS